MKRTGQTLSLKGSSKRIKLAGGDGKPGEAEAPKQGKAVKLTPAVHRRILTFLNAAVRPEDLVYAKATVPAGEGDHLHEDNPEEKAALRKKLLDHETAREIIKWREIITRGGITIDP